MHPLSCSWSFQGFPPVSRTKNAARPHLLCFSWGTRGRVSRTPLCESVFICMSAKIHCLADLKKLPLPYFCLGFGIHSKCCALMVSIFVGKKSKPSLKSKHCSVGLLGRNVLQCHFDLQAMFTKMMVSKPSGLLRLIPPGRAAPLSPPCSNCLLSELQGILQFSCLQHLQRSPSILLPEFASLGSHSLFPLKLSPSLFALRKHIPFTPFTASSLLFMSGRVKTTCDGEPAKRSFEPWASRRHRPSFQGMMRRQLYSVGPTFLL